MTLVSQVVRGRDGLHELKSEWSVFPAARENPLLDYAWYAACADVLYTDEALHTVVVRDGSTLCAVAPLAAVPARGVYELLGSSLLYEPAGVLYTDGPALHALARALADLRGPVALQRVAHGQTLARALRRRGVLRGRALCRAAPPAPYVPIDRDWETYDASLSSRRRQDLRRSHRRLERLGEVSITASCPAPAELDEVLDVAFRIESSGWKGRAGTGLVTNDPVRKFLTAYARRACEAGMLRVGLLRVGDRAIAMQIGVVHARRLWVIKIGYDDGWRQYSPGTQLTYRLIEQAFRSGYEAYEFLGSYEPWLDMWTPSFHSYQTVLYYPYTLRGLRALGGDIGAAIGRRLRRK